MSRSQLNKELTDFYRPVIAICFLPFTQWTISREIGLKHLKSFHLMQIKPWAYNMTEQKQCPD